MKIGDLINPSPKKVAEAVKTETGWKWLFLESSPLYKNRNFSVYFYVSGETGKILKIGSTDGLGGLESRVRATSNGDKGTPGAHDKKMQPTILELLNGGFTIDLYALVSPPIYREYLFNGELVKDEIVDSVPEESRYIELYKSKNGEEPPFNFNNKGKRPSSKGLSAKEFVYLDLQERLERARILCQD